MDQRIEHVFCPKCKSFAVDCESCDMPEWYGDDTVVAEEHYVCDDCGYRFSMGMSYALTSFEFLGEDEDGIYYEIIPEDKDEDETEYDEE